MLSAASRSSSTVPPINVQRGRSSAPRTLDKPRGAGSTSSIDARKSRRCSALTTGNPSRRVSASRTSWNHGRSAALASSGGQPRLQAAERVQPRRAAIEQAIPVGVDVRGLHGHGCGNPQVRRRVRVDAREAFRCDANHLHRVVVDEHRAADDVGGPAETVLPVRVPTARRPDAHPASRRLTDRSGGQALDARRGPESMRRSRRRPAPDRGDRRSRSSRWPGDGRRRHRTRRLRARDRGTSDRT